MFVDCFEEKKTAFSGELCSVCACQKCSMYDKSWTKGGNLYALLFIIVRVFKR